MTPLRMHEKSHNAGEQCEVYMAGAVCASPSRMNIAAVSRNLHLRRPLRTPSRDPQRRVSANNTSTSNRPSRNLAKMIGECMPDVTALTEWRDVVVQQPRPGTALRVLLKCPSEVPACTTSRRRSVSAFVDRGPMGLRQNSFCSLHNSSATGLPKGNSA